MTKNPFLKFLITKDRIIVDILDPKKFKNFDKEIFSNKKYKNNGIIAIYKPKETAFPEHKIDTSFIKVGNLIPFQLPFGVHQLKSQSPLSKFTKADLKNRLSEIKESNNKEQKQINYNKCIEYLKWTQTPEALLVVEKIKKELSDKNYLEQKNQLNYRFFHHSFKIYWLREEIVNKVSQLLQLLNFKTDGLSHNQILDLAMEAKLNHLIVDMLVDMANRVFCSDRNKQSHWVEDGSKLFGYFHILEQSLLSTIAVIEKNQKSEGIIFGDGNTISWDEGTFIYLWKPLNLIRYNYGLPQIKLEKKS